MIGDEKNFIIVTRDKFLRIDDWGVTKTNGHVYNARVSRGEKY